eukprot:2246712-Rhodomonas_salina.5
MVGTTDETGTDGHQELLSSITQTPMDLDRDDVIKAKVRALEQVSVHGSGFGVEGFRLSVRTQLFRARCAMSGTAIAYGAICLLARYALSGTDIAYDSPDHCSSPQPYS